MQSSQLRLRAMITKNPLYTTQCRPPTLFHSSTTVRHPPAPSTKASSGNKSHSSSTPASPITKNNNNNNYYDIYFLIKLASVSFVTGAIIKYGSLFSDILFQKNDALALALVLGMPIIYSIYFLQKSSKV
jgi:hypothetical protein